MTFNKNTFECECRVCSHQWRARTPHLPKKCPKCTSVNWNESGNRKFPVIIARSCGREEGGNRYVFCILDRIESPDIITEDLFYMREEDVNTYLNRASFPAGSAMVFIGSLEIDGNRELVVNEMNLIYIHVKAFRIYNSLVCAYNINNYYVRQKAQKRYAELAEQIQAGKAEKRKVNIIEQKKILEEEQERINIRRQILAEIEGE